MKYYTDCDCLKDHWRFFSSLESARKDFENRKCKNKVLYCIDDSGELFQIDEVRNEELSENS